ncbi:PREDICTED: multiple epidermal growth factor-like domains protein 6 [Myotis davidii]|uniref:multiple epidermal growth factor-like domains protein 6 n=1 Tax=Myotis davidii TaxID=225400 RepID=UPI0007676829|nr:PREDICTED: multiple epidermal growth factor-like domains protein 6 [Myotis davidii]
MRPDGFREGAELLTPVLCPRPHVCAEQELTLVGRRQPCVRAFSRAVPVWKPGCGRQAWCVSHERRTVYYTAYRQVYAMEAQPVLRCCPGWSQQPGDQGCLSAECGAGLCFNGGSCVPGSAQLCRCPPGFQGARCQHDVDECQLHNGGCHHRCVNTPGSYLCECKPGFRLHVDGRTCLAISSCYVDECTTGLAQCAHGCLNTRGSFKCVCHAGYELGKPSPSPTGGSSLAHVHYDQGEKLSSLTCADCGNGGTCLPGLDGCDCPAGWTGLVCNENCPAGTFGVNCSRSCSCGGAPCDGVTGQCLCPPGRTGDDCGADCPAGTFGVNCSRSCSCGGAPCDGVTGQCLCPPGRTGDDCGAACPAGWFGPGCHMKCSCANDGHCHPETGHCSCAPGWTGLSCQRGRWHPSPGEASTGPAAPLPPWWCPQGHFGPGCGRRCQCEHGGACDHVSGACTCPAGWRGTFCERACPAGFFGLDCRHACDCAAGAPCEAVSGSCLCPAGRQGPRCAQTCPALTYGHNCSQACSCFNGASCDPVHGQCHCGPGWTGPSCLQGTLTWSPSACPPGFHGRGCQGVCRCQHGAPCHPVSGQCLCPAGFHGQSCEKGCELGSFGEACGQLCDCEGGATCDPVTGHCLCPPGRTGATCDLDCRAGFFGPGCALRCDCGGGAGCDPVSGRCHCVDGYTGPTCRQGGPPQLPGIPSPAPGPASSQAAPHRPAPGLRRRAEER